MSNRINIICKFILSSIFSDPAEFQIMRSIRVGDNFLHNLPAHKHSHSPCFRFLLFIWIKNLIELQIHAINQHWICSLFLVLVLCAIIFAPWVLRLCWEFGLCWLVSCFGETRGKIFGTKLLRWSRFSWFDGSGDSGWRFLDVSLYHW